jgi:ABC-type histidine transport system ATPase subunit
VLVHSRRKHQRRRTTNTRHGRARNIQQHVVLFDDNTSKLRRLLVADVGEIFVSELAIPDVETAN